MIKIGVYLPVYGGWLPVKGSEKAQTDKFYFYTEKEEYPTYEYVKKVALTAEKIGIDSLWIPDHMLNPIKGETSPALEAWTIATAIAEATNKIIIAHTTLCEAFRYPAVLAKQAATLWEISKGRFLLSIGAGWYRREYEAYGLTFLKHDDRVERARETIKIIKSLWKHNNVTFKGRFYSITNGILEPKPIPTPPIWYAGMSEASKRLVTEEANGWLMRGMNIVDVKRQIEDMRGRLSNFSKKDLEFAIPALTIVRDSDREAENILENITRGEMNVLDRTLDTGLIGSYETVAQKIREFEKIGVNHILLQLTPTLSELHRIKKLLTLVKKIH